MTLVQDPELNSIPPPLCSHGPTLLFRDSLDSGKRKRKQSSSLYYACSASRDRKFCSFYLEQNRWIQNSKLKTSLAKQDILDNYDYLLDNRELRFGFCHDCCRVMVENAGWSGRSQHRSNSHRKCSQIDHNVNCDYFESPTSLLQAATANQNQAQYFFSDSIITFIVEKVVDFFQFTHVICVGCPTIHEKICSSRPKVSSILLDIDSRFRQFYPPSKFVQFNMFNGYFFEDKNEFNHFLSGVDRGKGLLLIDPPFGGLIECLAQTVKSLCDQHFKLLPSTILFFPYFNEHWITRAFNQELKITDLIVTYSNHGKFRSKPNNTSPVRIFTNIAQSELDFSFFNHIQPLYKWCSECQRFVFQNNRHCTECNSCTGRDATKIYHHCSKCQSCVKSSWSHCAKCKHCHLTNQACRKVSEIICFEKTKIYF